MMAAQSPYTNLDEGRWEERTQHLVEAHPLDTAEIVEVVHHAWDAIFDSAIGPRGFKVGEHILPKPQIMAFFLHELIALEFEDRYPGVWRGDKSGKDKDLVHTPDETFSVEIKASSHPTQIFGNRSYTQPSSSNKKSKSGYYLAVNFEKFGPERTKPRIVLVRFGWLDHTDWIGQKAATGQQARLQPSSDRAKLLVLYRRE